MHANGDDFMVFDFRRSSHSVTSTLVKRLSDRNRGVGFNQLAVIVDCNDAAARILFWNANGTVLDACGSATRGVAHILMQESKLKSIFLRTNRGVTLCEKKDEHMISVDMGTPQTDWKDIPLIHEADTLSLPLLGLPVACSMGNPHCTFFVDDLSAIDVAKKGKLIENHPLFPEKTNVHFVQILGRELIRLRIWERGGSIPLGSGSCSCAAVVAGIRRGLLASNVEVICDGGPVEVRWDGTGHVFLTGIVGEIFSGALSACLLS